MEFSETIKIIVQIFKDMKGRSEVECQFGFQLVDLLFYLVFADMIVSQIKLSKIWKLLHKEIFNAILSQLVIG